MIPKLRTNQPADPINVHPDVRRMLGMARSFVEPARALALWIAMEIDVSERHPDPKRRSDASELLALTTPIVKGYFTDLGFETIDLSIQCFGGHGYIEEWGLSQLLRDARVTRLYEGTNGIQALDLVGRKIGSEGGPMDRLIAMISEDIRRLRGRPDLSPLALSVHLALQDLKLATEWIRSQEKHDFWQVAGGAADYLRLSGHVLSGWMWLRICAAALAAPCDEDGWHEAKLNACRTFVTRTLCETPMLLQRIKSGSRDLFSQQEISGRPD